MPAKRPHWAKTLWIKAWPGWMFLGFAGFFFVLNIAGNLPGLRQFRISAVALSGGVAFLFVFGVPLLVSWGLWSLLGIRRTAFRIGLCLGLLLTNLAFSLWLIVAFFHPQM